MVETINKELTKADSRMIQGLSVMAMLILHLFDRLDYEGLYTPLFYLNGIPLSYYFGQLSDFCVMGFAFCSGYAHMKLFHVEGAFYRNRLKSMARLMLRFWIILLLVSLVGFITGEENIPDSLKRFLGNAFLYDITYCGAWWYLYAYFAIVLISPAVLRFIRRFPSIVVLCVGGLLYCGAYYLRFRCSFSDLFFSKLGPIGMTLFEYSLGCLFYKEKLFSSLFILWGRMRTAFRAALACLSVLILLVTRTQLAPSLFFAPASGLILISLFHFWNKPEPIRRLFTFLGKHSTNIWLTHMFFYLYVYVDLVYAAKYPPLILALMLCITCALSCLLRPIQNAAVRWIS